MKRLLLILLIGGALLLTDPLPSPAQTPPTATPSPQEFFPAGSANRGWTPVIRSFDSVEMVEVPAGCFIMGSDSGDDEEQPAHEVCFDHPFWIDRTEVSNAQFSAYHGNAGLLTSRFTRADHPRERVTWQAARRFCERRGARLPTEAEWEYAARGPEDWIFPWGNEFVGDNVVSAENSGGQTAPIASRAGGASWVGALDLSGNVWEWTADWYGPYTPGFQINPTGPKTGKERVVRGGSWYHTDPHFLRGSNRSYLMPHYPNAYVGFRCARDDEG